GVRNFRLIRNKVERVLTVSDDEIRQAMLLTWEKLKLLIEPSSATVIAAIQKHPETFGGRTIGAILSGGNIHPGDWLGLTGSRAE
ncbi:MAG: pyridoxal-phosphate dependent enzyme, partial [Lysobacterales bacterium]